MFVGFDCKTDEVNKGIESVPCNSGVAVTLDVVEDNGEESPYDKYQCIVCSGRLDDVG